MQAITRINRSDSVGGRKLLAALIAVAAALALGFQLGHVSSPAGHSAPTVTVTQSGNDRPPTHGALW